MYFYQTVHQELTKPDTLSTIGPTVSSFAYREPYTESASQLLFSNMGPVNLTADDPDFKS